MKLQVPSIGSMTQLMAASGRAARRLLLTDDGVLRIGGGKLRAQLALHGLVDVADRIGVRGPFRAGLLELHVQFAIDGRSDPAARRLRQAQRSRFECRSLLRQQRHCG